VSTAVCKLFIFHIVNEHENSKKRKGDIVSIGNWLGCEKQRGKSECDKWINKTMTRPSIKHQLVIYTLMRTYKFLIYGPFIYLFGGVQILGFQIPKFAICSQCEWSQCAGL